MTICLFIGGPADGERRDVERDPEMWRVAEWPTALSLVPFSPADTITAKEHIYFRNYWQDKDSKRLYTFYLHSSIQYASVFDILISGYRRPA